MVTHTIVVVVVVVVEKESDRVIVGPDKAIVGLSLCSETGSVVHNKMLEYEAECLLSCWMYDYIPLSVSVHTVQNLGWIFAGAMHAKVKSVFSKHMQVNGFIIMILMSPHPHPSKVLQGDRQSWRKKLQLPASCRKNTEKIFSTMDHYQTPSKGKHQVALESNLYLVSKLFCDPLLKLRLIFFVLLPRSCKSN